MPPETTPPSLLNITSNDVMGVIRRIIDVDGLKLELPAHLKCDYNNIRKFCKLSFMDCDPFGKAEVKVSSMDRDVYSWCREVAMKVAEELGKIYLPKL